MATASPGRSAFPSDGDEGSNGITAPSLEELGVITTSKTSDLYEVGPFLGRGKFATVFRATRRSDGKTVALKRISLDALDAKSRDKCLREIRIVQTLNHENIIRYLAGILEHNGSSNDLVLVFEYADAGDLKRQLRKLRERQMVLDEFYIWKFFSQIADAVAYMHERRILHRDLKPANIFITVAGVIKIGDLGLGRLLSDNTLKADSKVGTPLYMSPEVIKGHLYERGADVWSCGCILYELAAQRSPFKEEGLSMFDLFTKITTGAYPPLPDSYSIELCDLVGRMLQLDADQRPRMDEVAAIAARMRGVAERTKDALAAAAAQVAAGATPSPQPQQPQYASAQEAPPRPPSAPNDGSGGGGSGGDGSGGGRSSRSGSAGRAAPARPATVAPTAVPLVSIPFTPRLGQGTPTPTDRGGGDDDDDPGAGGGGGGAGSAGGGAAARGDAGGGAEFDGAALTAFRQAQGLDAGRAAAGGRRVPHPARPSSSFPRGPQAATAAAAPAVTSAPSPQPRAGSGGDGFSPGSGVATPGAMPPQPGAAIPRANGAAPPHTQVRPSPSASAGGGASDDPRPSPPPVAQQPQPQRGVVRRPGSSAGGGPQRPTSSSPSISSAAPPAPSPAAAPPRSAAQPSAPQASAGGGATGSRAAPPAAAAQSSPPPPPVARVASDGGGGGSGLAAHIPPPPPFRRRTAAACADLASGAPLNAASVLADLLRASGASALLDADAAAAVASRVAFALPPSALRRGGAGSGGGGSPGASGALFASALRVAQACFTVVGATDAAGRATALAAAVRAGSTAPDAAAVQLLAMLAAPPLQAPPDVLGPGALPPAALATGYGTSVLTALLWLAEAAVERAGARAEPLGQPLAHVAALRRLGDDGDAPGGGVDGDGDDEEDVVDDDVVVDDADADAWGGGGGGASVRPDAAALAPVAAADAAAWRAESQRSHTALAAIDRALAARVAGSAPGRSGSGGGGPRAPAADTTTTRPGAAAGAGGVDWRARLQALQHHAAFAGGAGDASGPGGGVAPRSGEPASGAAARTAAAVADVAARCRTALDAVSAAEARWNRAGAVGGAGGPTERVGGRRIAADAESVASLIAQHRALAARQRELQADVDARTARVAELDAALAKLGDDVEIVTEELETRAARLSSTAQLQAVRAALASLRRDARQLDVVIGVCHQQLLQRQDARTAAAPADGGGTAAVTRGAARIAT